MQLSTRLRPCNREHLLYRRLFWLLRNCCLFLGSLLEKCEIVLVFAHSLATSVRDRLVWHL